MRYALQFSWFQAPSVGGSHVHSIFGRISCCNTHSAPNSQQDLLGSFIYHKNSICFIQVYIYTRHGSVNVKPVFVFQLLAGQTCSRKTKRHHKDVGKARTANLVEKLNYLERKRRKEWKPNIPKKRKDAQDHKLWQLFHNPWQLKFASRLHIEQVEMRHNRK